MSTHPRLGLNDHFTNPVRLSLMAALAGVDEIDFKSLREALDISDSALSKHSGSLEQAGYVTIRKGFVGKRPRTWLSISADGKAAFTAHVASLRELTAGL
ncbi:transcriptional regulator [Citricoccus zhacaiensis]|uniref:Transcriptional regulator n=1 Tax=Citricoccus zhacaiensis TaxID=489142 RepID=A0ABQ2LPT5_9MICC|nr:transcriptional regulator [Citricoccus zhacaiensis]GGO41643.1 transcriptional regulator [Citricoccus zhacaiensis]